MFGLASFHPVSFSNLTSLGSLLTVYGNLFELKRLSHPNICTYLDVYISKNAEISYITESHSLTLSRILREGRAHFLRGKFGGTALGICEGIGFLHKNNIVCRSICSENILFDSDGTAKISNFATYYLSHKVDSSFGHFPLGKPHYTAPEVFLIESLLPAERPPLNHTSDIWALGILMTEILIESELWRDDPLKTCIARILGFWLSGDSPLPQLLSGHDQAKFDPRHLSFIEACLRVDPLARAPISDLLGWDLCPSPREDSPRGRPLDYLSLRECYWLWRLIHGDQEKSIHLWQMPLGISIGGDVNHFSTSRFFYEDSVQELPHDYFLKRFYQAKVSDLNPLLNRPLPPPSSLPLVIRESDFTYQQKRLVLFTRLLKSHPFSQDIIQSQALLDIPPALRPSVWASILHVPIDYAKVFDSTDYSSFDSETDRQIGLDVRRCHQYDYLLQSFFGRHLLRKLLTTWVVRHPEFFYWQGLDSICAPFVLLLNSDPALAYACFDSFIARFLPNFFLKDNSAVIREHMTIFSQLISFHDPSLANHLHQIGFYPELYAVPWFMTLFAHSFSLPVVFHLWDSILLQGRSFPLFVAISLLLTRREDILRGSFNDCIIIFSELMVIDVESVIRKALSFQDSSPPSSSLPYSSLLDHSSFASSKINFLLKLGTGRCPRIIPDDLILMLSNSPPAWVSSTPLFIDLRRNEEFIKGCLPGAVHYEETALPLSAWMADVLEDHRHSIKVCMCRDGHVGEKFAERLLELGYAHVCYLYSGLTDQRIGQYFII